MEKTLMSFQSLIEKAENYANTSIEVLKLKAVEKSSFLLSKIIVILVISFFFIIMTILFSIGLSLWIGDLLGKPFLGFFIVGGFQFFIGFIIYQFQNRLIYNQLIKFLLQIFDSKL